MPHLFFTIGHSTRPLPDFLALLRENEIDVVADVRRFPGSRRLPQYSAPAFADGLAAAGIAYRHFVSLGGRQPRQPDVAPQTNALWREPSFHNYADHALGAEFRVGLAELRELGRDKRCVIMCAEAVWWRCHRRIITDWLIAGGDTVLHILGPGHVEPAHLIEGAQVHPDGSVTYPINDLLGLLSARPRGSGGPDV